MKIKLFSAVLLLLVSTMNTPALAQSKLATAQQINNQQIEKTNNIKQLMALICGKEFSQQINSQVINGIKSEFPQVSQGFWNILLEEINNDELNSEMMANYSKHYTNEEIKGIIAFYQTPLGKKMIKILPKISQESIEVLQKYGIKVAKRAIQKLEAEGYIDHPQKN
ncbi:MAG: DUF2059 domain-containing protein [Gloeocapsa sp. UFS-A4-WI-NPMV-4B04]|jgi:hypothetical protein|nr:DUF2059 domain-containing protein [Gloeocapsa sp. UFS-A4-WI-NPMV-4B04]